MPRTGKHQLTRTFDHAPRTIVVPAIALAVSLVGAGCGAGSDESDGGELSATDTHQSGTEANVAKAIDNATSNSPEATSHLTSIVVWDDGEVNLTYIDPDQDHLVMVTDSSASLLDKGPADDDQPVFSMTADEIPPIMSMSATADEQLDDLWTVEIKPPDDTTLLPDDYSDGDPIIEFSNDVSASGQQLVQAGMDGKFAEVFSNTDVTTAYAGLASALEAAGIDTSAAVFAEYGATGPSGGSGSAAATGPGDVMYAGLGPDSGLGAGEFTLVSGQFPTFEPDETTWDEADIADLFAMSALDSGVLKKSMDDLASSTGTSGSDLESYSFRVGEPDTYQAVPAVILELEFTAVPGSKHEYNLDGTPYED